MKTPQSLKHMAITATALALISCGGATDIAGGGIGGTGISQGPVTGFGSVFVNGIEFQTTDTQFEIDDVTTGKTQDDLRIGMVVLVKWEKDGNGIHTASSIIYSNDVLGPVSDLNLANNRFAVLGQSVLVTSFTVFEGANATGLANLTNGDIVEVSGLVDDTGAIRATRIELKSPSGAPVYELKGIIRNIDETAMTFMVRNITVNYSSVTTPPPPLTAGACVDIKTTTSSGSLQFFATDIELDDDCSPSGLVSEGQEIEIEGYVSDFNAGASTFEINGQTVQTSLQTSYENGTSASLRNGIKLEVEGALSNGVIAARKISFRQQDDDPSTLEIEGAAQVDYLNKTLTINGITIAVNALTIFEDGIQSNLGNVNNGEPLKAHYYTQNGANIALNVERD